MGGGEHWPRSSSFPLSSCASRWTLSFSAELRMRGGSTCPCGVPRLLGLTPLLWAHILFLQNPSLVLPQKDIFVSLGPNRDKHPSPTWGQHLCVHCGPLMSCLDKTSQCALLLYFPCRNGWHLHCATALRRRSRDPPWHGNEALFWHCPSAHGREGKA